MPKDEKKETRGRKKTGVNTLRIQTVLNIKYFREKPALDVFNQLIAQDDWTQRKIITEALIALGEKHDSGWKVAEVPNEVKVSNKLIAAFDKLADFAEMIASMDITQLRQVQGFDETVYNSLQAEGLKRGAARMLSDDTTFENEDW